MKRKSILTIIQVLLVLTLVFSISPMNLVSASNQSPERIISLFPSNTEIVYALGKGSKLVGVSDYCNYPIAATKLPKLGGITINTEKILALKPDLILLHQSQAKSHLDAITLFKKTGVNVVVVNDATSFNDAYNDIRIIGRAVGATKKAESVIASMKAKMQQIAEKSKQVKVKRKVWVEVDTWGGLWTTGRQTFMNEMLSTIGAINVAKSYKGWVSLTEEKVVELRPQVVILTYGDYDKDAVKNVLTRKAWQNIPAVKEKKVYLVTNDTVVRPGPRLIDGVEALARAVYPEIYK
jgi:iron complex transport system substrate-binding protein